MSALEVDTVRIYDEKDAVEHHTDRFVTQVDLVYLRRGQLFHIDIRFKSTYNPKKHRVLLQFSTGPDEKFETSACVRVRCSEDEERDFPPPPEDWGVRRLDNSSEPSGVITVEVVTPVWLPVGTWSLRVYTHIAHAPDLYHTTYEGTEQIYFLFNPWNKDDDTYFDDKDMLDEYILNDAGKICDGHNSWKVWDFGQFEESVLPAFELALERDGELPHHLRGNPVKMARHISRVVNANDGGILVGNWYGKCEDGKKPWEWMGSADILKDFLKTEEPVKYGQCWVFSGVAATICRALGIPARCVTNLASGHDRDTSLTIDILYDEELNEIGGSDSIWNFHCWTDVWMRRPDLDRENSYDGWQVIDATPQEKSKGIFQCGPAPLAAIIEGKTHVSYDVPFVFTEVNGDRARWIKQSNGKLRLIDVREDMIGQLILTNEPFSEPNSGVLDITSEYKHREGSDSERNSIMAATRNVRSISGQAERKRIDIQRHKYNNDVHFQDEYPRGIYFGENFNVVLHMHNTSDSRRTINFEMNVDCVDYQKKIAQYVRVSGKMERTLEPNHKTTEVMTINADDYAWLIQENSSLRFTAKCIVAETGQPWLSEDTSIEVQCPMLIIEVDNELKVNEPTTITVRFDKPVNFPLSDCKIVLRGSPLQEEIVEHLPDVPREDTFSASMVIYPTRVGVWKISAKFTSAELPKAETWAQMSVVQQDNEDQETLHDITLSDRALDIDDMGDMNDPFFINSLTFNDKLSIIA